MTEDILSCACISCKCSLHRFWTVHWWNVYSVILELSLREATLNLSWCKECVAMQNSVGGIRAQCPLRRSLQETSCATIGGTRGQLYCSVVRHSETSLKYECTNVKATECVAEKGFWCCFSLMCGNIWRRCVPRLRIMSTNHIDTSQGIAEVVTLLGATDYSAVCCTS